MRKIIADQDEFLSPESEEYVEIAISRRSGRTHQDIHAFAVTILGAAGLQARGMPEPFIRTPYFSRTSSHLGQFAGIEVPHYCTWDTYVVANEDFEYEIILDARETFISYRWTSTA